MLIFTNRIMNDATDASAFGTSFALGSDRLGMATVTRAGGNGWALTDADTDVDAADAKDALVPLFQGARPVLVYIHGNNNTPAACFERCAKLASLYDVEVIGFSWPSEGYMSDGNRTAGAEAGEVDGDEDEIAALDQGNRLQSGILSKIQRYHRAGLNGRDSADAMARFLRMIAAARLDANVQPFTVAAHSLGAQFLQYSLAAPGAADSLSLASNVVLLAPCVRAVGHAEWLARIRPASQLFVTFNKGDSVLAAASIADNGFTGDTQIKLGTDPTPDRLHVPYMRYISCTNAGVGFGGHGYFAQDKNKMPKKMLNVFGRILGSRRDLEPGEIERKVYGIKGDEDGLTCYFNAPDQA